MSTDEKPRGNPELESLALLAEALEERSPDAGVRARLLEALHGPERFTQHANDIARHFSLSHADTREVLLRICEADAWRPGMWPGSTLLASPALERRRAVIARLPVGVRIPRHKHATHELTYVIDGVLVERAPGSPEHDARRHESGALLSMPPESEHALEVSGDEDCLVVFALGLR